MYLLVSFFFPTKKPLTMEVPYHQEMHAPESSMLMVHLDRALKNERAQAMDRIQRSALELSRAQAVIAAATQRAEHAESRATAAEQNAAGANVRAQSAEARARKAEQDLEVAKTDWAKDRQDLLAKSTEPPLLTIQRLTRTFQDHHFADQIAITELVNAVDGLAIAVRRHQQPQFQTQPQFVAPQQPPFLGGLPQQQQQGYPHPRIDPTTTYPTTTTVGSTTMGPQQDHQPQQHQQQQQRDSTADVHDEMDKLLRKYQHAKEKLKALERMYPDN